MFGCFSRLFQHKLLAFVVVCGFMIVYLSVTGTLIPGNIHQYVMRSKSSSIGAQFFGSNERKPENEAVVIQKEISTANAEMSCHLPVLNPLDPSIQKYNTNPELVDCSNNTRYPLLFITDTDSNLIQVNQPEKHGYYFCCYNSFQRKKGSETKVDMSKECKPIKEAVTKIPETVEFIQISCANDSSTTAAKIVVDLFGFINLKKSVEDRVEAILGRNKNSSHNTTDGVPVTNPDNKETRRKLNIVIFGIDAVSHMNFIRTMPLSYKYLTKNLTAMGLWGYTKVGDNTFPNIVPALTGLFVEELNTTGQCWKSKKDVFDKCPFIWKDFASQGYTTAYGEDAVWMTSFNYQKEGFSTQPTDYYHNTGTYLQEKKTGHAHMMNADICFGPRLSFQVLLDYTQKMAATMKTKNRNYFHFIWANALTHDYLNEGKLGDHFLLQTLKWFKEEEFLEDTVFVLMSDHGIRWGDIRKTVQGKIEERMPFLYFVFPQWFKEKYRSAVSNLLANKHRLTTPFDLYETLKDLLYTKNIESAQVRERHLKLTDLVSNESERLPRGISLFLPIPLKRTCPDAGIVEQWCVCRAAITIPVDNNTLLKEAARSVVHFINGMFIKAPQCEMLQLNKILNAQVFQSDNKKVSDVSATITDASDPRLNQQQVTFSLSLSVKPSNATFDAITTRHTDGSWAVSGDISRINLYGEQSRCVTDYNLKKFCYCG